MGSQFVPGRPANRESGVTDEHLERAEPFLDGIETKEIARTNITDEKNVRYQRL